MPIIGYHGTTADFERFELGRTGSGPDIGQGDTSGKVGIFFSRDREVATTFTVTADTYDEALNRIGGSRILLRNPYFLDGEPWRDNAQVLSCELDVTKPMTIPVINWVDLVGASNDGEFDGLPCPFEALRNEALSAGYDHIIIPAARPGETTSWGSDYAVEYEADTIIVLDPSHIKIFERTPSDEAIPPQVPVSYRS